MKNLFLYFNGAVFGSVVRGCLLKNMTTNGINPWSCFFLCAVLLYSPLSFGGCGGLSVTTTLSTKEAINIDTNDKTNGKSTDDEENDKKNGKSTDDEENDKKNGKSTDDEENDKKNGKSTDDEENDKTNGKSTDDEENDKTNGKSTDDEENDKKNGKSTDDEENDKKNGKSTDDEENDKTNGKSTDDEENDKTNGKSTDDEENDKTNGKSTDDDIEYRIKMDKSIFLEPPEKNEVSIYVHIRDTSGNDFKLQGLVTKRLDDNGYKIAPNAKHATYVLQANILFAEEVSEAPLQNLNKSDDDQDNVCRCADWLGGCCKQRKKEEVKKLKATKLFSVVVDIEVRERTPDGGKVIRRGRTNTKQNTSLASVDSSITGNDIHVGYDTTEKNTEQNTSSASVDSSLTGNDIYVGSATTESEEVDTYSSKSDWIRYRARVIATAKGKDITLCDIEQDILRKLSKSLSDMF